MEHLIYFFPIVFLGLMNFLFCIAFKKKFGQTIQITFIISAFILYFSQWIFSSYLIGMVMLFVLTFIGTVFFFICLLKNKHMLNLLFSNGFISYLILAFIILIMDYHRYFSDFDEFFHWGMMIKESLRLDAFYSINESRLIIHKDYPPFLCMLEVLWCKLIGYYNEGAVTTCINLFEFSLIIPYLIERVELKIGNIHKRYFSVIALTLCLFYSFFALISMFDQAHVSVTLLADIPLAFIFGFGLLLVLTEDAFDGIWGRVIFILTLSSLIMTKQAGLAMAMVIVFLYFLIDSTRDGAIRINVANSLVNILIPMFIFISWNIYIHNIGVSDIRSTNGSVGQFSLSKIDFMTYINALTRKEQGIYRDVLWDFFRALYSWDITSNSLVPVTYITAYLIILAIIMFLFKLFRDSFHLSKMISTLVAYTVGTIGYAFMLSVMFLFCFTKDEMLELRGYSRYVDSFIIGEIISLIVLFGIYIIRDKSKWFSRENVLLLTILVTIIFGNTNLLYSAPQIIRENPYKSYTDLANNLIEKTIPDTNITLIYNAYNYDTWYGIVQSFLYYYANDRNILWGVDIYNADLTDENIKNATLEQIDNSDYLYVIDVNENLNLILSNYIDGPITNGTIYKKEQVGDMLIFTAVE